MMTSTEFNYEKLNRIARSPEEIFETRTLVIKLHYLPTSSSESFNYHIEEVNFEEENDEYVSSLVRDLNQKIKDYYNNNQEYSWSLFYLFKEIIKQITKNTERGKSYNFFRGQTQDWETYPALFRDLKLLDNNNNYLHIHKNTEYYKNFEEIYRDIARRYPETVKYYSNDNNNLEKSQMRADQLSMLQHYGLKTSLLDITENPFIALLFMVNLANPDKDIIYKPQLECYKLDYNSRLFCEVTKSEYNHRIKVQKGAFLNYDYLFTDIIERNGEYRLSQDNFQKIDRIVISVEIDFEGSEEKLRSQQSSDEKSSLEYVKEVSDESLETAISELNKVMSSDGEDIKKNASPFYKNIADEINQKLNQYNYYYDELFPDLVDYIQREINIMYR